MVEVVQVVEDAEGFSDVFWRVMDGGVVVFETHHLVQAELLRESLVS